MAFKVKMMKPQYTKVKRTKPISKIHIQEILFFCLIILNFCHNSSKNNVNSSSVSVEFKTSNLFVSESIYLSTQRKNQLAKNDKNTTIILFLIILSNDINPNPGPKRLVSNPANIKCSTCTLEIQDDRQFLSCSSCSNCYHITCQKVKEGNACNGFEWICSTKSCAPNHESSKLHQISTSKNRYHALNIDQIPYTSRYQTHPHLTIGGIPGPIHFQQNQSAAYEEERADLTPSEIVNRNLLGELTNILPADYEGKCLCRICFKEVKDNHRGISCDVCDMWSHLKCTDVSVKLYNYFCQLSHFKWICNKCRQDEQLITETVDVSKFNQEQKPEKLQTVKASNKEILIIHMNCRSISNKREELEHVISETNADIICLTETWLDDSHPKQSNIPEGYRIIRKDRNNSFKQKYGKNRGGGVAILYKEEINVEKKEYLTEEIDEILWVHVKVKQSFMLGLVYRAEYTDILKGNGVESTLERNIRKANEISNKIIITGDFNIDLSNPENKNTQILNNIYESYGLKQILDKPTRYDKKSAKPALIDHFWLNDHELEHVEKVGTFIGISDHLGTFLKLRKQRNPPNIRKIKCRNYKSYDKEEFNKDLHVALESSSIQTHILNKDVNSGVNEFISVIQNSINKFAPMKELKIVKKFKPVPWFTKELKELISTKNEMLQDSFLYGFEVFKHQIKVISNNINHLKRKLKRNFLTESLKEVKNDPKKTWDIINTVIDMKKSKDRIEPDIMDQEKTDKFNKYFANVGKEIQDNLKLNIEPENFDGLSGFEFQKETSESITKIINSLKNGTSTGYDEISSRILKDAVSTISSTISDLVNLSYETHEFPTMMKKATITALHKKKDINMISNYRPISILPAISKVFEKSATNQLATYLEQNNILSRNQHAYRRRHSTVTCLAEVVDYLYNLVDNKKHSAVISLDLSKAFDSISHQLLLNKLSNQGLSENSILWIKSYLSERKQVTKFKDYTSTEELVTAGVPQGSIMGPLLFLCFTNDLYEKFDECKVVSYADDTQIIVHSTNLLQLKSKIKNTILKAQDWYTKNSMKNNIDKTEILIINSNKLNLKNTTFKFKENGKNIKIRPSQKIEVLGIILDDQLNWTPQSNRIKRNAFNSIRHLHRINHLLPVELRIQLYNSLVLPLLDYADVIWGGCGEANSRKMQITQNFAIRSITGAKKYESATESFRKLKFLNLEQRRMIHNAVFANKSLLHLNPVNISMRYLEQCPLGDKNTRSNAKGTLNLPPHKTAKYQQSPFYRCVKAWNSCPDNIPTNNPKIFKSTLQKQMINSTYQR